MPRKKGKFPADKNTDDLLFREARFVASEANDEQRSIPIVLATETPVKAFDFVTRGLVDEVLDMAGVEIPTSGYIPMLDSHRRDSVRDVLGQIRELKRENGELRGVAYFSADAESVYRNYREGILTDFSVGGRRMSIEKQGAKRIVRKWRPLEGSAVVIGADPNAKAQLDPVLRAYVDPESLLEEVMNKELLDALVSRGMPADLEGQAVIDWIGRSLKPAEEADAKTKQDYTDLLSLVRKQVEPPPRNDIDPEEIKRIAVKRYADIDDLCRKHQIDEKQRKEWADGDISVDAVAREILTRKSQGGTPVGVTITESSQDKFYAAALDGLVSRAARGYVNPAKALDIAKANYDTDAIARSEDMVRTFTKPSAGAKDFQNSTLSDVARMYLETAGVDTRNMTKNQWVQRAIRHQGLFGDDISRGDTAYHTTGSFANLMLDAANKTLRSAYDEAQTTYQRWVRQAPSASDFKTLNRIMFGELPDPEVVPENMPYPEKSTSDAKESYFVEKYGEMFSISWESMVNDDLSAIGRTPAMQGNAMRRKINKVCYGILTANAALSDGITLFHSTSHNGNLDDLTLSAANLNTGFTVMATQTGLSGSGTILNIKPRFLIVPAALEAAAWAIRQSTTPPDVGGSAAGTSGVANIYGPGGPRGLEIVSDGQLDATSATGWYLAADPAQIDTVEITFLQGYEAPVLSREEGFEVDSMKYKITQVFGVKAIDYRGLYQGDS